MTDSELTKLCAQAMGLEVLDTANTSGGTWTRNGGWYHPLQMDEQAMALVKKFGLALGFSGEVWFVYTNYPANETRSDDLNRAICQLVAKLQSQSPRVKAG